MDLRSATSIILRAQDAAAQLRLADTYMQAYNKMPSMFVLPAEHAKLQPIIEAFANNSSGFVEYLRAVRDSVEGVAKDEIHDLYRTVSVRVLQHSRRARLRRALDLILPAVEERNGSPLPYENQMRVLRCIEQIWGSMRIEMLSRERNAMNSKRLDEVGRAALLQEFWRGLDSELAAGRVPLGTSSIDTLVEAANS